MGLTPISRGLSHDLFESVKSHSSLISGFRSQEPWIFLTSQFSHSSSLNSSKLLQVSVARSPRSCESCTVDPPLILMVIRSLLCLP